MTINWLRLWHDLPNDPKWAVIAAKSEQEISLVIATYIHMLVNASQSSERGILQNWCDEDVAISLRTHPNAIERIRTQMNGKVLDGKKLLGWDRRQPIREDGSAERARYWREKKKQASNANEHFRTQTNTDKDKEEDKKVSSSVVVSDFGLIFECGINLFPSLQAKNTSEIHKWVTAGCNIEQDILPVIRASVGRDIGSWSYFNKAIMNAKASREKPLPNGEVYAITGKLSSGERKPSKSERFKQILIDETNEELKRFAALPGSGGDKIPH